MGMYLSLEQVEAGQLPEFMRLYSDYDSLPWLWQPFQHLWLTVMLGVLVPVLVAGLGGWLVFRRRIRGPYFAILTQASALVFWLLLVGQLMLTAGTNGLTNFQTVFGRNKYEEATPTFLYYLAAGLLVVAVLMARQIVNSRYGRLLVAVRDGEDRVRFLGYDPAVTKTVAFAVGAGMAGAAGMLAAPIIGLVAPNQFTVLPSILIVGWVAVGGRGTIYGAVVGAVVVSLLRTRVSESRPEDWQYFQGLLFVVVVAFAPGGLAGLARLSPVGDRAFDADGSAMHPTRCRQPRRRSVSRRASGERHGGGAVMTALLEISDLVVSFDGFRAVDGVSLSVEPGELRFLIGPNGAGKTTIIDVVTGLTKATSGSVLFEGEELLGVPEYKVVHRGIGRSFQKATVFAALTVLENLDLANSFRRSLPSLLRRRRGVDAAVADDAGTHRPDRGRQPLRGHARPWSEAVAGDRDAAGPATEAAAPRRAGRGDEPAGTRRHGRAVAVAHGRSHDRGDRARHGLPARVRPEGHRAPRGKAPARRVGRPGAGQPVRAGGVPRSGPRCPVGFGRRGGRVVSSLTSSTCRSPTAAATSCSTCRWRSRKANSSA